MPANRIWDLIRGLKGWGTWKFITEFTRSHHLSLSWARLIQSKHSCPNPTLYSYLRLSPPSGLLHLGFSAKILYVPLHPFICATYPKHLNLLEGLIINWIDGRLNHRRHQIRSQPAARIFANTTQQRNNGRKYIITLGLMLFWHLVKNSSQCTALTCDLNCQQHNRTHRTRTISNTTEHVVQELSATQQNTSYKNCQQHNRTHRTRTVSNTT